MSEKIPFQMKNVHRIGALLASLLMLYLGATGSLIQVLDLTAILRDAPESDATMQSINEGAFGNFDFAVLSTFDLDAKPLPQDLDYGSALDRVLVWTQQLVPDQGPSFIEFRMSGDRAIGQTAYGRDVKAFDLASGDAVTPIEIKPGPFPSSLRQTLKEWHRFWSRKDVPGVWFELLSGLILWVLIITGLTLYFRMLRARSRLGRHNPFWSAGGMWRTLHRGISIASAVFLIAIAASGTWLGFESVWHTFIPRHQGDPSAPLTEAQARQMAGATLTAFRALEPQTPIKVLRLRVYGPMEQGVVVTGDRPTRQLVFDTKTGKTTSLTEPGYPETGFPLGIQVHEDVKHFHSGYMFGLTARWMNLFAGVSLIFLSVSGVIMYLDMWRKRRRVGRNNLFWR